MCRECVEERKNLLSQSPLPVAQGLGEEKALISMYTLFKENNFGNNESHMLQGKWGCVPEVRKPVSLKPMLRNNRSHFDEKFVHHN